jgi:hypothetical protein
MARMRDSFRRSRSMTVAVVPASVARPTSMALAASTSSARSTSRSAAACSAASFAAVDANASSREAALARCPSSCSVLTGIRGYRRLVQTDPGGT